MCCSLKFARGPGESLASFNKKLQGLTGPPSRTATFPKMLGASKTRDKVCILSSNCDTYPFIFDFKFFHRINVQNNHAIFFLFKYFKYIKSINILNFVKNFRLWRPYFRISKIDNYIKKWIIKSKIDKNFRLWRAVANSILIILPRLPIVF